VVNEDATFLGSAKVGTGEVTPASEATHLSGQWLVTVLVSSIS
jgi:hypothetical protein